MKFLPRLSQQPPRASHPDWPETGDATRVLIEHPDPCVRDILVRKLQDRGYAALGCGGPRADQRGAVSCPLLHQEHCPAVDGADIIVNGLSMSDEFTRIILRRAREQHRDLPVIVEAPSQLLEEHNGDLADAQMWPLGVERLTLLIDTLVDD